jgi:hypothetical protein
MRTLLTAALLTLSVACEKSEPPPAADVTPPTPAPVATPSAPAAAAAEEPIDLPTEEDFEEEAEQKVTPKSLEAELDALEKEITGAS